MGDDEFDFQAHERLRERVASSMDGVLWTFKQHYKAGDILGLIDRGADVISVILAGILTFGLIWEAFPNRLMVGLAISIAVITGFKSAARPQKIADAHIRAGDAYHRIFQKFRDFTVFDLADQSYGLENMRADFDELAEERRELNENQKGLSSIWYYWLKVSYKVRGESPYVEVDTSNKAKEKLTEEAKLYDSEGNEELDSEVKNTLTGEAKLTDDSDREEG